MSWIRSYGAIFLEKLLAYDYILTYCSILPPRYFQLNILKTRAKWYLMQLKEFDSSKKRALVKTILGRVYITVFGLINYTLFFKTFLTSWILWSLFNSSCNSLIACIWSSLHNLSNNSTWKTRIKTNLFSVTNYKLLYSRLNGFLNVLLGVAQGSRFFVVFNFPPAKRGRG